ncbi:hypothetical protein F5890DRAFT_1419372 [Lentinula detonsa]|uniref:Uncharacterized protein n=1 Tax=Lentinula detonsa TaxID=2804962 RepID=A0AA38PRZ1_9AGAR|nr:hypothetical protein F5890DRAFT_1419372 [Lentinula detonsa]
MYCKEKENNRGSSLHDTFHDQAQQNPCLAVVHLDTLAQGVHLIPVYGSHCLHVELKYHQSLDIF